MDTGHWSALPVEKKISNSITFFINSFQILIYSIFKMGDGSIYSSGFFFAFVSFTNVLIRRLVSSKVGELQLGK